MSNCKHCHKPLTARLGAGAPRQYCDRACNWKHRHKKEYQPEKKLTVRTCCECGTVFLRVLGKGFKWCSEGCMPVKKRTWLKNSKTLLRCEGCGKPFTPKGSQANVKNCSRKCGYRSRDKKRWAESKQFRLCMSMRGGMRRSLGERKNGTSWESLVDYDRAELKEHIEKQFSQGMTWDDFMSGEIHIDHILPLSSFSFNDHTDPEFKQAWALTNLRPMWAKDNLSKGAEIRHLI